MADIRSQKAQAGHVVRILAGGYEVGFARASSIPLDYGTQGAYALHSVGPFEHIPLRWAGRITLDEFVIHRAKLGEALQLMNIVPMGPDEVVQQGIIDIEVLDDQDDVMVVMEGCTPVSFNYDVRANEFSGQNATFESLNCRRAAHPQRGQVGGGVAQPATT